jgi:hypothetical protein
MTNQILESKTDKVTRITVLVNEKPVQFEQRKIAGRLLKETAIAQGIQIQPDFVLYEVKGQGKLKSIGDDDEVTLNDNDKYRAVAPDDNS